MKIMIKHRYIIFFVLFFIGAMFYTCKTSKLDITFSETIFVYFKKDNSHQYIHNKTEDSDYFIARYQYILHDINKYPQLNESIILSNRKYKDFDNKIQDNPTHRIVLNKRFLKNNKDIILTLKNMKIMDFDKTFDI